MPDVLVHLPILRCPITMLALREATVDERAAVAARLGAGPASADVLQSAVVSEDGRYLYPVIDNIFVLQPDAAIPLDGPADQETLNARKRRVQEFYDELGWAAEGDQFVDEQLFEDDRPVTREYRAAANRRIEDRLPQTGRYLLDAASGPVQYEDYLEFSRGFEHRVCVDFSRRALRAAAARLGEHGVYIQGDVTRLPLASGSMDAAVSLHTIYHVPSDEQRQAFLELHRVLREGARAVVIYSWRRALLPFALTAPFRVRELLGRVRGAPDDTSDAAPLYFAPHTFRWFRRQQWPFRYEIVSWRAASVPLLQRYVGEGGRGSRLLRTMRRFEDQFPRLAGRVGQYPLIVISK